MCFALALGPLDAFTISPAITTKSSTSTTATTTTVLLWMNKNKNDFGGPGGNKMTSERRQKLGISEDEDEYDLYKALENNTDPFITKVIAGSLIIAIVGLLIVGVIVPSLTDYGDGVCSPIQSGGRC